MGTIYTYRLVWEQDNVRHSESIGAVLYILFYDWKQIFWSTYMRNILVVQKP